MARRFAEGVNILVEDGEPARHLYVVSQGSVELLHEGELVDVLEPGECFGHPSLLTGMAPAFTVRGHEADVDCYLIESGEALSVLGRPAGAGYVAASLRERLTRTGHVVHALPEMATVRVADLITRSPVFCQRDDSIRAAAQTMTDQHGLRDPRARWRAARDPHRRRPAARRGRSAMSLRTIPSRVSQSRPWS